VQLTYRRDVDDEAGFAVGCGRRAAWQTSKASWADLLTAKGQGALVCICEFFSRPADGFFERL
jgi:hypothetical protein